MCKVYNKRNGDAPRDAVYIGRGSKWGNPYVIGKHGNRRDVIDQYYIRFLQGDLVNQVHELRGKDLVCYCAPLACHGDVLLKYANEVEE